LLHTFKKSQPQERLAPRIKKFNLRKVASHNQEESAQGRLAPRIKIQPKKGCFTLSRRVSLKEAVSKLGQRFSLKEAVSEKITTSIFNLKEVVFS
jgi:hypothetical protein